MERFQEYQNTSEAPENSNVSSSSKVTDSGGIIPSSLEAQTQQASSPPQLQEEPQTEELQLEEPQLEETLADVHEQTVDPVSLIIASVVSSIQTSTAPPQGNILSIYCR